MVNTLNLGVRFILELVALIALALWGANQAEGLSGVMLAIIIPATGAWVWGTFRVPDDPSNNGHAPIQIPGILRLLLELSLFVLAFFALISTNHTLWAVGLISAVVIHYVISFNRIKWLIRQ